MIKLTDLAGNGSFTMGGKKFEYGKVYSNPYATAFKPVNEAEGSEDHEVSMAQNQLDSIIKNATELKQKMGEEEKQIPAWIQDHITNSENYISQAASNYHEYGDSNEAVINEETPIYKDWDEFVRPDYIIVHLKNGKKLKIQKNKMGGKFVYYTILKAFNDNNYKVTNKIVKGMLDRLGEEINEAPAKTPAERIQNLNNRIKALRDKMGATKSPIQKNLIQQRLKNALQSLSNIKKDHGIKAPHREGVTEIKFDEIRVLSKEEFQNEAGPCWKGYKQVGMKNKNGKEVPNCVPEGKMNEGRGVTGIQNDISKVLNAIQSELEKYKSNKGTDKAKQNVENLKKLNVQKQKLEMELDSKVSSMYADYDLDQLSSFKKKR